MTFPAVLLPFPVIVSCLFTFAQLPCSSSVNYSKWVPFLMKSMRSPDIEYTKEMFEESMIVNAMAAALIGLAVVMPILVLHPKFRNRPQRIITVTHDRYG